MLSFPAAGGYSHSLAKGGDSLCGGNCFVSLYARHVCFTY
nr:MAG TPA: hypothetical protein [Caudoviricetes sp.]